jgi:hypothetical protein
MVMIVMSSYFREADTANGRVCQPTTRRIETPVKRDQPIASGLGNSYTHSSLNFA